MTQQTDKEKQKKLLTEIMNDDAQDGLYDHVPDVRKMVTAVEFIRNELERLGMLDKGKAMTRIFEKAKAMEKEQIIEAWRNGENDSMYPPEQLDEQAKQYYNEKYGG